MFKCYSLHKVIFVIIDVYCMGMIYIDDCYDREDDVDELMSECSFFYSE